MELKGKRVLVVGLGESGLAMAKWLHRQGAIVRVADSRENPPNVDVLQAVAPDAELLCGEFSQATFAGMEMIALSPGVPKATPAIAAVNLPLISEIELFAAGVREQVPASSIIAITGSNGKTTTTALTAHLLNGAGVPAIACGNISPSALDALMDAQDASCLPQVWVVELSSFQLDGIEGFEPDAAAVLNVTQDHLDWHGSMQAYAAAKARIFGGDALMVVNRDDATVRAMVPQPPPADTPRKPKPKFVPRRSCSFGLDAPRLPGDFGLIEQSGIAWLVRALPLDEGVKLRKGEAPEIHLQQLMPADALRIRGRHNAANALAALALATAIGCPLAPMLHALREYRGEAHRVEPVGLVGGVEALLIRAQLMFPNNSVLTAQPALVGLLLFGDVPCFDMDGMPCSLLADALGARPVGSVFASTGRFLSVAAASWAAPAPSTGCFTCEARRATSTFGASSATPAGPMRTCSPTSSAWRTPPTRKADGAARTARSSFSAADAPIHSTPPSSRRAVRPASRRHRITTDPSRKALGPWSRPSSMAAAGLPRTPICALP